VNERSVDVLWAPDGNCVAITNWASSNLSELFLGSWWLQPKRVRGVFPLPPWC